MTTKDDVPEVLGPNSTDYVAASARAVLGAVPFAGSLLAEIAGTIIPNQRIDRVADFAAKLEQRMGKLEQNGATVDLHNPEFTDLVEEAIRQASRATTSERRAYLASMLANSLSEDEISHSESKHLMRILGELSDVEIIWLRFFDEPTLDGDGEFRQLHANVLQPIRVHLGSPQQDRDSDALQRSYADHLIRLGLVTEAVRKDRSGAPEFNRHTGKPAIAYRQTSTLGALLLRQIGLPGATR